MKSIASFDDAKREIARHRRDAIVAFDRKCDQDLGRPSSCYGGVFHGLPGEKWPANNERSLIPWLQIVAGDLPARPRPFNRFELVSFFIDSETWDEGFAEYDDNPIVVRAYESLKQLVPMHRPSTLTAHPHYAITWKACDDFPCLSHFYQSFAEDVYDRICNEDEKLSLHNKSGIKIGGWPTLVQRDYDLLLTEQYTMQIDMTENYMFGDSGVSYIYLEDDGRWYVSFDCC